MAFPALRGPCPERTPSGWYNASECEGGRFCCHVPIDCRPVASMKPPATWRGPRGKEQRPLVKEQPMNTETRQQNPEQALPQPGFRMSPPPGRTLTAAASGIQRQTLAQTWPRPPRDWETSNVPGGGLQRVVICFTATIPERPGLTSCQPSEAGLSPALASSVPGPALPGQARVRSPSLIRTMRPRRRDALTGRAQAMSPPLEKEEEDPIEGRGSPPKKTRALASEEGKGSRQPRSHDRIWMRDAVWQKRGAEPQK